jgi:hypothetical protein
MGPAENLDLICYYKGRTVWLVQPDKYPAALTPYTIPEQEAASLKLLSVRSTCTASSA